MIHEDHKGNISKETSQNPLAARAKEEPGGQGELEIPNSNEDVEGESSEVVQPRMTVVRCTLAEPNTTGDWRRRFIFHTHVKY